ncbi:hypothetical protein SEVIR_2G307001v4 [Setaria viridis]
MGMRGIGETCCARGERPSNTMVISRGMGRGPARLRMAASVTKHKTPAAVHRWKRRGEARCARLPGGAQGPRVLGLCAPSPMQVCPAVPRHAPLAWPAVPVPGRSVLRPEILPQGPNNDEWVLVLV